MCGIAGIMLEQDERSLDERLRRMVDVMRHRGPDAQETAIVRQGRHGLGQSRLAIIDLERGRQPYADPRTGMTIVYNGELYNYRELRAELTGRGISFQTGSDTEVVLKAYSTWGSNCLDRFVGMYAFAVYEPSGRCFLARDRFGIKPLYYHVSDRGLVFASEIKAMLRSGMVTADFNAANFLAKLTWGYTIDDSTILSQVHMISPGCYAFYEDGQWSVQRYYEFPDRAIRKRRRMKMQDAADGFADIMSDAVRGHLVSDVKVVTSLSGGLDSSIVTAEAKGAQDIEAYSIGYGAADDEVPFARQTASHLDVMFHERLIPPQRLTDELARMMYHLEEPIPHIQVGTSFMGAWTVRHDLCAKVALIGEGADELLCGYDRAAMAARLEARLRGRRWAYRRYGKMHHMLWPDFPLDTIYTPTYADALGAFLEADRARFDRHRSRARTALECIRLADIHEQLPNSQLIRIDKLFMAHSVEARVPFLDHRVAEYLWQVPDALLLGPPQKWVARHAYRDVLPEAVVNRPKFGIGGTQNLCPHWWPAGLENVLRRQIRHHLAPRGIFRQTFLEDLLAHRVPQHHKVMLALGMLEFNLQMYLDGCDLQGKEGGLAA